METNGGYLGGMNDADKRHVERVLRQWYDAGLSRAEMRARLAAAGVRIAEPTFFVWTKHVSRGRRIDLRSFGVGCVGVVNKHERDILSGFLVVSDRLGLVDVSAFAWAHLGLRFNKTSAGTYVRQWGFGYRARRYETQLFSFVPATVDWLAGNHAAFSGLVVSVDFMHVAHRRGWPWREGEEERDTDVVVSAVWSDGEDRTPAVLFTRDPERAVREGARAERVVRVEDRQLGKWGVPRGAEVVGAFLEAMDGVPPAVIVTDDDAAFRGAEEAIVRRFARHVVYPATASQVLCANDVWHGAAKAEWRRLGGGAGGLLRALDRGYGEAVAELRRNLQLGRDGVDEDAVRRLLGPGDGALRLRRRQVAEYRAFIRG